MFMFFVGFSHVRGYKSCSDIVNSFFIHFICVVCILVCRFRRIVNVSFISGHLIIVCILVLSSECQL